MSRTTKSTLSLARMAYDGAKRALPLYSHRFSPRKFNQPQLLTILVLKEAKRSDYRGIAQELREWRELREVLELEDDSVPSYSTLCKAASRLLREKKLRRFIERNAGAGSLAGTARRPAIRSEWREGRAGVDRLYGVGNASRVGSLSASNRQETPAFSEARGGD